MFLSTKQIKFEYDCTPGHIKKNYVYLQELIKKINISKFYNIQ